MRLTLENIKSITRGALEIREENGSFFFERYTEEQKNFYKDILPRSYVRTVACASIILDFYTDSRTLSLDYEIDQLNMVVDDFLFFDVWEDDRMCAHVGAYAKGRLAERAEIKLSEGKKRVRVYFPNIFKMSISNVTLDDGASLEPAKIGLRTYVLGDSITQGYDAHFPSLSYPNILARDMELCVVNQSIGGEIFRTETLGTVPVMDADVVTIAYGTNDWISGIVNPEVTKEYFEKVKELYPKAKIFYLSPIWHNRSMTNEKGENFYDACKILAKAAEDSGIIHIDGDKLMPKIPDLFSDGEHPLALGFIEYARNLKRLMLESGEFPDVRD